MLFEWAYAPAFVCFSWCIALILSCSRSYVTIMPVMWPSWDSAMCDHVRRSCMSITWISHVLQCDYHVQPWCESVRVTMRGGHVWPSYESVMCEHHMSQLCDHHHFSNISLHLCHLLILLLWMWNGPFVQEMCCSTPNAAGTATGDISPTTKDLLESTFPSQIYSQCTFKKLFSY